MEGASVSLRERNQQKLSMGLSLLHSWSCFLLMKCSQLPAQLLDLTAKGTQLVGILLLEMAGEVSWAALKPLWALVVGPGFPLLLEKLKAQFGPWYSLKLPLPLPAWVLYLSAGWGYFLISESLLHVVMDDVSKLHWLSVSMFKSTTNWYKMENFSSGSWDMTFVFTSNPLLTLSLRVEGRVCCKGDRMRSEAVESEAIRFNITE